MSALPADLPDNGKSRGERAVDRMLRDVSRGARVMRRIQGRYNNLRLFKEVTNPDGVKVRVSADAWSDTPDLQVLMERRDRYLQMEADVVAARAALSQADLDPEERIAAFTKLAKYEDLRSKELAAIDAHLAAVRKDIGSHLANISSMTTKFADLHQKWRMHEDRINKGGLDDIDDAELAE